ncbi:MAG: hypothetical protein JOZ89_02675 [Gammaproteobacteria bacterium]|nr:hypothetical protein [Gammaproteobacteria bacterium]
MKKATRLHLRSCAPLARCQLAAALAAAALGHPALAADQVAMARDYLVQKVCADPSGKALPTDPYRCESPNHLRTLSVGESLPYHKVDQAGVQRHDSYPAMTPTGSEISVNPFDFKPFGTFNLWGDGYDIYLVRDGWVSASGTKDGGGFAQTFFTQGCKAYNGWAFFPTSALSAGGASSGQATLPISGRYWEQNGENWPGRCPSTYGQGSLTTWDFIKGFPFGGTDAQSTKTIDTIRVVHGFETTAGFAQHGHLEVFYFTRLYGATRWEVWVPASQGRPATHLECSGAADEVSYRGMQFRRTACHDWTRITPASGNEPDQGWPVPELNLLKNFHFGEGVAGWNRSGASAQGNQTNWSLRNSTLPLDSHFRQPQGQGVRFLAINCGGECTPGQRIYQDIPLSSWTTSGPYTIGATVRAEAGTGTIELGLEQIDRTGHVLSASYFEEQVSERNERKTGADSEVLSSTYVASDVPVSIGSGAAALRFYIAPRSIMTFDIVDAWLMKREQQQH